MKKEFMSSAIFLTFAVSLSMAWYFAWVKPNTERMYAIMDCMNEITDHSEEAYVYCAKDIQARMEHMNELR